MSDLVKCPACDNEVSEMAEACPKCGHPLKPHDEDTLEKKETKNKPSKKEARSILGFCCGLPLLLLVIGVFLDEGGTGDKEEPDGPKSEIHMAKIMCENFMEKRLKTPSTADFAGAFDGKKAKYTGKEKDGFYKYKLNSYVDSENSFGANIRTKFLCKIKTKDFESWKLVNLKTY